MVSTARPLAFRVLPSRLSVSLFDRFYSARREHWLPLYREAKLAAAPSVTMELIPGDRISDLIAFTGVHEPDLTKTVKSLACKGGRMIDIGANLGYFSLLWVASHPANQCIAFEAAPRNLELLRRNVERNGFTNRIRVKPNAAAARPGKLYFDLGPEDQTGWGGIASEKGESQIEVQAVRVDEMITPDERISLLKVDVEGADAWALMGCDRLLQAKAVDEIWFEQNRPRSRLLGIEPDAAQSYLESVGYRCTPVGDANGELVQWSAVPR